MEVTLFQSPKGDSGLCYLCTTKADPILATRFSPPKGIQVFATYQSVSHSC